MTKATKFPSLLCTLPLISFVLFFFFSLDAFLFQLFLCSRAGIHPPAFCPHPWHSTLLLGSRRTGMHPNHFPQH